MLSSGQFMQLCQDLGLSREAQAIIEEIRSSPPSRRVRSAAGNVSVRYPSRKMGVTIQAESHRNELAGIYQKEHDPATLEYYDQPPPIKLLYQAPNGRRVGVLHTPDYFVLRTDGVGWEEWKTEDELLRLRETMPHRYRRDEAGGWRCPPGERYAEPFGLFYRVRSSAGIDWVLQRNLLFLEDYLRADCPPVADSAAHAVLGLVASRPGIALDQLLGQVEGAGSDAVYTLIATDRLFVDLCVAALAEPERVRVFGDEAICRAQMLVGSASDWFSPGPGPGVFPAVGTSLVWDGRHWTIVNVGATTSSLLGEDGALVELPNATFAALAAQGKLAGRPESGEAAISPAARERLGRASPADFREANRRYEAIAARLRGATPATPAVPARTLRSWRARWREAEQLHRCGYIGLLPRRGQSGNRRRKLPERTLRLLEEFIAEDYETLKQKRKIAVYGALLRACEARGLTPPSYKTFARAVDRRPRQEQVAKRQGPRAAAQEAPFYWELTLTTPRHGDRPFEIGHIDHTQLDVELLCSRTGRNLGRPWATFLSDAFSRRLLAVALTFDPPSYRSCMIVVRECVRRHHRLPQTVVVDGGAEFAGVYFETLLARYECTKKTRPGGQPRFGSVGERLFGTTNTRLIHSLVGNTQLLRSDRQVTRAVDPREQARWTLERLSARLGEWAYEVYDTLEHPALGQSPREAWAAGLAQSGQRAHRRIADDEDFRLWTLPTTRKGTATLQRRLGVKIHHLYYWSEAFLDPELEGTALPVRFDPFDAGIAYAFVRGRWVRCISEHHARLAGRSEREVQLATVELRRRQQRHAGQLTVTARALADFLASVEAEEVLLEQRLRDAAVKDVVAGREGIRADAGGGGQAAAGRERARPVARSEASAASRDPGGGPAGGGTGLTIYEDY
jgi:transposase InsO family protein